ncbi:MAG: glycosyltransferase family 2 protein [Alphaproteobacteria bacterium]|nr:glycosyltransferase family 2 protein [Alphaproteobacteria bacterium]
MLNVSVVIPVYNEEATILACLERVRAQRLEGVSFEILVVDDGSKDETLARLKSRPELYSKLIERVCNGGKGAAVQDGIRAATGDYILFQDADLEYDPCDYAALLAPITDRGAEVVMGSRFVAPSQTRVFYFWHRLGNSFITLLFNLVNNTTFTDIYSCYLVFKRSLIDADRLTTFGWEQQAEILTKAVKASRVWYEVPINYHGRSYDEGKKIRAHHVILVLTTILSQGLFPKR